MGANDRDEVDLSFQFVLKIRTVSIAPPRRLFIFSKQDMINRV